MWCTAERSRKHPRRRFVRHVCLRNLFSPFRLGFPSIHSLPEAGSWERQFAPPVLQYYGWITSIPSLQLQKKNRSHAEKQKVWSRSCALQGLLCTIVSKIWIIYRILIVLLVMTCDCCKPMNSCRDWAFSNSGLEVGLPAFQLPMFSKCDALPKTDFCDCTVCLTSPWPLWNLSLRSLPQSQKLGPPPPEPLPPKK